MCEPIRRRSSVLVRNRETEFVPFDGSRTDDLQKAYLRREIRVFAMIPRVLVLAAGLLMLWTPLPAAAEDESAVASFTPPAEFQEFVTAIAREHLPDDYEKAKNWGNTKRVWAGVKIEREGRRLETRRRYREVNDGAWQKYRIDVIQPEKHFRVQVTNIRQQENTVLADVTVEAKLHVFGRHTQWERGLQLFSVSADANACVRLRAQLEITARLDAAEVPPDLLLAPRVTDAELEILDFRLERVSDLSGPLIKSLSSTVREVLEEKLAEKQDKLVERLNKSLAKQEEKFRISPTHLLRLPLPLHFEPALPAANQPVE